VLEGAADTDPLAGRGAGRIEDRLWAAFLDKARAEGLSNTDAMRRMIRIWADMAEPVSLDGETGSGVDQISRSLPARSQW
jgi:hypothetical protein